MDIDDYMAFATCNRDAQNPVLTKNQKTVTKSPTELFSMV